MLTKNALVGAWQLESWTIGYSDSERYTYPYGEDPQGLLVYSADGWMSASIAVRERGEFPSDVPYRKLPDEMKARAFVSYFHYAGRFRVQDGDVIHYVAQSLNPNFPGTEQLRHAELDGQTLVLSGKDESDGVTRFHTLVWHRAEPTAEQPPLES